MGYIFNAWLEQGAPRLRVINPSNGTTSLTWDCPTLNGLDESAYRREMQNLFKQLILLSSAQDRLRQNLRILQQPLQEEDVEDIE